MNTFRFLHPFNLLVFSFLLFTSCSQKNGIQLIETNASGEVPLQENLRFAFSTDMVPDSLTGEWLNQQYIEFSPDIPGKYKWESPSVLIFSPLKALPPATRFRGKFLKELTSLHLKKQYDLPTLSFYTREQELLQIEAYWNVSASNQARANVVLHFRYPQDPKNLIPLIEVMLDNQKVLFQCQHTEPTADLTLTLTANKPEDHPYVVSLTLKPGLIPSGGKEKTNRPISAKTTLASPLILAIQGIETVHDGIQGIIKINCSQQVSDEQWIRGIQLSPITPYRVKRTDLGVELISESFLSGQEYQIRITKGLQGVIGGMLKEDYQSAVSFGEPEPFIAFEQIQSMFLSAKGLRNIKAKIAGMDKVTMTVTKMYENNLQAAINQGYYSYYEEESSDNQLTNTDYQMGDVVFEKEFDVRKLPRAGDCRILHFDIKEKLPDFWGIYHVTLRSSSEYWRSDSRFVATSDIGLIAKSGQDQLTVFARSIETAEPKPNVIIQVYGRNNQIIGSGSTNRDGVLQITCKKKDLPGFRPAMITARYGADFNFLPFTKTHVEHSRFDVGGKWINASGLDAFLYSARDLYRPGEKVPLTVVVRNENWKITETAPLKLKVRMPNGAVLTEWRKSLNHQGALAVELLLPASAITGTYTAQLYTAQDILLQTFPFLVEEFMPDRIKVTATPDKNALRPGEEFHIHIQANNLFGTPASGRKVETEQQIQVSPFTSPSFPTYHFNLMNTDVYVEQIIGEAQTNEQGKASLSFRIPESLKNMGQLECRYFTTVFDETGRPVNRLSVVPLHTQETYLGISSETFRYYPVQQPIRFPVIALNQRGKVTSVKARVQVIRRDYKTNLVKTYDSYYRYESRREDVVIIDRMMDITDAQSQFIFSASQPGEYAIRLYNPGAYTYVAEEFYCYGGGGYAGMEVNREGKIDISSDRMDYLPGDNALLFFKTPFNGKLLVTIESKNVTQYFTLETSKRLAELKLPLTKNEIPNVYVSATLIKPHQESELPLTVAHGYLALNVSNPQTKIPLSISVPLSSRSKRKQQIQVKSIPGSQVTLAAVDEGILQITSFKTPDIHGYFYARRALQVQSYDLYPLLFPEVNPLNSSTGGDGFDLGKRINPVTNNRIKPLAYWSGITDANGQATIPFELDIPSFSGSIRLMAVAWKDGQFGSCEKSLQVADPIIISTAAPRFLRPGDSLSLAVTLTNTTAKDISAVIQVTSQGKIKLLDTRNIIRQLNAGAEQRILLNALALAEIGEGKVNVVVKTASETFTAETDIPVRAAAGFVKKTATGIISGGVKKRVNGPDFISMPGTEKQTLFLGSSPFSALGPVMARLIQYPYGCTEQQISAVFPGLYFSQQNQQSPPLPVSLPAATYKARIEETMRTIQSRQLQHGGIALWNGGDDDWFTTIYAAHFLTEAKKSGYPVESGLLEKIQEYLVVRLRQKKIMPVKSSASSIPYIAREIPYSLFVLALGGKTQTGTMQYYASQLSQLSSDSKYMLAAAFALSGGYSQAKNILPQTFSSQDNLSEPIGGFSSPLRNLALSLYTLILADENNPSIAETALRLNYQLLQQENTTQENAFGFLALYQLFLKDKGTPDAVIETGKKTLTCKNGQNLTIASTEIRENNITVNNMGKGSLYYSWTKEGISATANITEEDKGIRVRRAYFNRFGQAVSGNRFKQNDLVIIALTLTSAQNLPVEQVVVSDFLPAGFELENTRVQEIAGMNWIKDACTPLHTDMRDDRVHFFTDAGQKPKTFYYAVRCVTPGNYQQGAASADAMYAPGIHSYHGSQKIKID